MKRKKALFLICGLVVLGAVSSVTLASGSTTQSNAARRASTHVLDYKQAPGQKVLGYKHAPAQAAAARAAQAQSYMRRLARGKVDHALVRKFRLLRQARTASASSESTVADAISGLVAIGATQGADPSQAGHTTVGFARDDVWLVPGSTGACLVDVEGSQGAGSGCSSTSAVDAGKLWTLDTIPYGVGGAMTQVLLGAAPDGNASVTVSWTGAGTTVVPVIDNFYSVPIGSHTGWKSVTLKNSAGAVVAVPGMPSLP